MSIFALDEKNLDSWRSVVLRASRSWHPREPSESCSACSRVHWQSVVLTMRTCLQLQLLLLSLMSMRSFNALRVGRAIHSQSRALRPTSSAFRLFSDSAGGGSGGRASAAVVQDAAAGGKKASPKKLDLNPPKGTRDFYPEEHRLKSWLFGKWRAVGDLYGFEEYDAPVLENEDLYIRKAGEEITGDACLTLTLTHALTLTPPHPPPQASCTTSKTRGGAGWL
jgi:hypothetical protein